MNWFLYIFYLDVKNNEFNKKNIKINTFIGSGVIDMLDFFGSLTCWLDLHCSLFEFFGSSRTFFKSLPGKLFFY